MKEKTVYTFLMNTLLLSAALGIFWLILLFVLCFIGVHVLRLAHMGQLYRKQETQTPEPPKGEKEEKPASAPEAPPQTQNEPIYYIVERKKRVKSSLGEPKQIRFK